MNTCQTIFLWCFFFVVLATLEENKEIENILQQFQMPTMKYGTFNIAGFGKTIPGPAIHLRSSKDGTFFNDVSTDLSYEMMLPPNFLSSKRYPLLLDV